MCCNYPRIKLEPTLLNLKFVMIMGSRRLHYCKTRTSAKFPEMKNASAKRAKPLSNLQVVTFFNCCRRRRGCLSSLKTMRGQHRLQYVLKEAKLLCRVVEVVKHENLLSNKLIKVKLLRQEDNEAHVSIMRPSDIHF